MIPLIAKNNLTKEELKFNVPQSWKDISIEKHIQLSEIEGDSEAERIAVLTGMDKEFWRNLTDMEFYDKVKSLLLWSVTPMDVKEFKVPSSIKIPEGEGVKTCFVPSNLKVHSVGQFEDMKVIINDEILKQIGDIDKEDKTARSNVLMRGYCKLVAIYIQPEYNPTEPDKQTGSLYSLGRAKALEEILFKECSSVEVCAIGNFFLNKHIQSQKNTMNSWGKQRQTLWKRIRGLLNSLGFTGFTLRSKPLRMEILPNKKKSFL